MVLLIEVPQGRLDDSRSSISIQLHAAHCFVLPHGQHRGTFGPTKHPTQAPMEEASFMHSSLLVLLFTASEPSAGILALSQVLLQV